MPADLDALVALCVAGDSRGPRGGWVPGQLAAGRGTESNHAADLVPALASGRADRLSGRHLTPADNLDAMLADVERIEQEDLRTLRLRR